MGCGHCGQCQPKCGCESKCPKRCGCPESILSIEADSADPAYLRFNLGGRSVWYDFTSVVKAAETCTHLSTSINPRSLIYDSECGRQTISAKELGKILHLGDLGDVDVSGVKDNAILVYRKDANCGENCDGKTGWVGVNPTEVSGDDVKYVMGSDEDGQVKTIAPPVTNNKTNYLTWDGESKTVKWKTAAIRMSPPVDPVTGKVYRAYLDPNTFEIVFVEEDA